MKSVLHYPGGKRRIAPWIISHMPDHHSYLEPYFGCGVVLFAKAPSAIETVNDLDGDVVNFFRVIQNPESRRLLQDWISYTPYARQVYDDVYTVEPKDDIERAGYFAVRSMMGYAMIDAERYYFNLLENGATPQEARSVLPNSTKTEIVITANYREWRNFFKLRTALAAHPQMREVTVPLLGELKGKIPVVFDDIVAEV